MNGQPLTATDLNFSTLQTLTEGENTLNVSAVDRAGNVGSAVLHVTLDSQPPTLTLSAPSDGTAGGNVALTLNVADDDGLEQLEVSAGGMPVWSADLDGAGSATRSVNYTLAPTLAKGTTVTLQASAVDRAGNPASATADILVSQAAAGPGTLQGEVYDDRRGLRLAGADFAVFASDEAASGQATDKGAYFAELPAGEYLVRLSKPGYTAIERTISVPSQQNAVPFDARLTPTGTGSVQAPVPDPLPEPLKIAIPLDGGTPIALTIPVGALSEAIFLRATPVSNQGMMGVLPAGWSPLAVLDLRALDAAGALLSPSPVLTDPAALSIPLPEGVDASIVPDLVLARYDEGRHQWIAVSTVSLDPDGLLAETSLSAMGQYALLAADPAPLAPPAARQGQPLAAIDGAAAPDFPTLTAAGRVAPPASPPLQGLTAVGEVVLTPPDGADPLSSGTVVDARIDERYELNGGESVQPDEYVQDLLLYRTPCVTNPQRGVAGQTAGAGSLRTTFPVSPSHDYGFANLLLGKVGETIWPAEQQAAGGMMVGPDGARLLSDSGDALEIPAGALSTSTPVALHLAEAGAAGVIDGDFDLLRALSVDLTGQTLQFSAVLSIPVPSGFDSSRPVLLARVVEVGGVQRLKLVGFGEPSGSMIVSTLSRSAADGVTVIAAGITVSGTYVFLQAKAPVGFVAGRVDGVGGSPFAGARVSVEGATLVDSTSGDGRYLLALPLAPATVTALDPVKLNRAEGSAQVQSAWQLVPLDLVIQVTPPRLLALDPVDGAVGVEPNAVLRLTFSEPVDHATVGAQSVVLKDADGNVASGVFSFSPDGAVVSFYPGAALKSETPYTLTVDGIRDLQGYVLPQAVTSRFTSRDTTPPPPPAAGAIGATFPDAEGMIDVTATQGSAEADDTVLVINDTSGEIDSVSPQSDGSFTARIAAQLGDEIQIVLMDPAGNQTLVSYLTFKAHDGRTLVTAKGGKVEGEGGSRLEIPQGALVGPAVVKITPVPESALPHPVPSQAKFLAALDVETGDIPFQQPVTLSVPVPADMPEDAVPFVARPVTLTNPDGNKEQVYRIVDSAKVENGRLTSACPPFDGPTGYGIFTFLFTPAPLAGPVIVSGTTYRDMNGDGTYTPSTDLPIRGAVIRCPAAENFISYSDSNGHYASYGFTAAGACRSFAITAIHPLTMFRTTANLTTCDAPYIVNNFNFKLADKETRVPDTVAPVITVGLQVLPGQMGDPQLIAGTVSVGAELSVLISIIDQQVSSATLSVEFKTPDKSTPETTPVDLNAGDSELQTPMKGETPALYSYAFTPVFSGTMAGNDFADFRPDRTGTYTFVVEAKDAAGNRAARRIQVRAVDQGETPGSLDGAPQVDSILPADGAVDVMVTTNVVAWFSEPVRNVNETTFRLFNVGSGEEVPAYVTTRLENGHMQAMLVPKGNLTYGKKYRATLSGAIKDVQPNPSAPPPYALPDGDGLLPLPETSVTFTTKVPRAFDLTDDSFTDGRDIDIYTRPQDGRTFVYVTSGTGWLAINVTDPTHPAVVHSVSQSSVRSFRGVAVEQDGAVMGMTDDNRYADGNQYGYVRFYDLAADPANPANPPLIGQEKLAEAYSGIPGRLDLAGNYAYVATAGAGLQVVDIDRAKSHVSGATSSDGSAIVGVFDTAAQGDGEPNDVRIYAPGHLLVTTNGGYLLLLSAAHPEMPTLSNDLRPGASGVTRAAAVGDYQYIDDQGNPVVIDSGGRRFARWRFGDLRHL